MENEYLVCYKKTSDSYRPVISSLRKTSVTCIYSTCLRVWTGAYYTNNKLLNSQSFHLEQDKGALRDIRKKAVELHQAGKSESTKGKQFGVEHQLGEIISEFILFRLGIDGKKILIVYLI